jgi:hypothetical protein
VQLVSLSGVCCSSLHGTEYDGTISNSMNNYNPPCAGPQAGQGGGGEQGAAQGGAERGGLGGPAPPAGRAQAPRRRLLGPVPGGS